MKTKKKRSGFFPILLRVLGGILALILLALLCLWAVPLTETENREIVEGSGDWMARLPDELPLNQIAIPGTHDTATCYVQLAFFSKCQSKGVAAQLEAGARYLDIRLGLDGERMKLMHGFTSCKAGAMPWSAPLYLEDVLRDCYSFLARHPGETILFAVKQEYGDESVEEFQKALDKAVSREDELWLLTDRIPSLGDARGKLVLLRRYEDEAGLGTRAGVPQLWENQNGYRDPGKNIAMNDQGTYRLWVQDRYEYNAPEKWNAFTAGLENQEIGKDDLAIHFLSTKGTATYGHPYFFAGRLNPSLSGYELMPGQGWIVVDFITAPLARHIYGANFG